MLSEMPIYGVVTNKSNPSSLSSALSPPCTFESMQKEEQAPKGGESVFSTRLTDVRHVLIFDFPEIKKP